MDNLTSLLEVLKSRDFEIEAKLRFNEYSDDLLEEVRNLDLFTKMCRAYLIDEYSKLKTEEEKKAFVSRIERVPLEEEVIEKIIYELNACVSKQNDIVDRKNIEFFNKLKPYLDKPICKELSEYKDQIFEIAQDELGGIFTIQQIKDGDYFIPYLDGTMGVKTLQPYILNEDDIKAFEDAHKAGVLVDLGHQIYDNSEYVIHKKALGDTGVVLTNPQREFGCDYEEADKNGLGGMIFTACDDRLKGDFEVVFEDGVIMQYHNGTIRRKKFTLNQILAYIYADIAMELEEIGVSDYRNMDPDEFESTLNYRTLEVFAKSDNLGNIYSKKMIDSSKKYVKKLTDLANKYRL